MRARRATAVSSVKSVARNATTARAASATVESLEDRMLFAVNAWKSAVSGAWDDATRWSLGHVPTETEDVEIKQAGSYTVTLAPTGSYRYVKSLKVGGVTGTQALTLNRVLYIKGSFAIGSGDTVNVEGGGNFYAYGATGSTGVIDGTLNLKATASKSATMNIYAYPLTGSGKIIGVNGGAYTYNYVYLSGGSIGSGLTLQGKNINAYNVVNKGTIKLDGASTDTAYFSRLNNQGSFSATGTTRLGLDTLTNAAGKTITLSGTPTRFTGDTFNNLGTINASNTTLDYGMVFSKVGTINRNNVKVLLSGIYEGGGKAFTFNSTLGQWIWYGGSLRNGSFDPTNPYAPKMDPAQRGYGTLDKVTLTNSLNVPAGFYFSSYQGITLANSAKIILNGTDTLASSLYNYEAIKGNGEIVFAGTGRLNTLGGNGYTVDAGITIRGKTGTVGGGLTLNGVMIVEGGGTFTVNDVINNGNMIAAGGTFKVYRYTGGTSGQLTAGIGGTTAGTNYGRFQFSDSSWVPTIKGTFNTVLLNGYQPGSGVTFNVASFQYKAPTGSFTAKNVDAGNNKGFDLTQTATAWTVKSKNLTGGLASRDSAGNLTVNGTTGIDTITTSRSLGILSAVVNGRKSVFYDRQLISATINGGDNNDTITVYGSRAVKINGGNGNDKLTGGDGNDYINGGEGSDTLIGGKGNDNYAFGNASVGQTDTITEYSGGGIDTLDFSTVTGKITVRLNSDTATAVMTNRTVKTTTGASAQLENAIGGTADDYLVGNNAANWLIGGKGNDTIEGGIGNDTLEGGDGNDTLRGGDGNDTLKGGAGNDSISGGNGTDSMYGEAGVDTFYAADSNVKDLLDGGADLDKIGSKDAVDILVSVP
jgi:hypothetical protein